MLLADMVGPEPNWPKHLLVTHAIELAINAYFIFEKGLRVHRGERAAIIPTVWVNNQPPPTMKARPQGYVSYHRIVLHMQESENVIVSEARDEQLA